MTKWASKDRWTLPQLVIAALEQCVAMVADGAGGQPQQPSGWPLTYMEQPDQFRMKSISEACLMPTRPSSPIPHAQPRVGVAPPGRPSQRCTTRGRTRRGLGATPTGPLLTREAFFVVARASLPILLLLVPWPLVGFQALTLRLPSRLATLLDALDSRLVVDQSEPGPNPIHWQQSIIFGIASDNAGLKLTSR